MKPVPRKLIRSLRTEAEFRAAEREHVARWLRERAEELRSRTVVPLSDGEARRDAAVQALEDAAARLEAGPVEVES